MGYSSHAMSFVELSPALGNHSSSLRNIGSSQQTDQHRGPPDLPRLCQKVLEPVLLLKTAACSAVKSLVASPGAPNPRGGGGGWVLVIAQDGYHSLAEAGHKYFSSSRHSVVFQ